MTLATLAGEKAFFPALYFLGGSDFRGFPEIGHKVRVQPEVFEASNVFIVNTSLLLARGDATQDRSPSSARLPPLRFTIRALPEWSQGEVVFRPSPQLSLPRAGSPASPPCGSIGADPYPSTIAYLFVVVNKNY